MNIQIPKDMRDYVQQKVASGEYPSEQDVVTHALELLQEHERKLSEPRREMQTGIDSGDPVPANEVFARLAEKHRRRVSPGGLHHLRQVHETSPSPRQLDK